MLFSENTIPLIYEYTQGIPRLVNILCDACLQTPFATHAQQISLAVIHEADKELDLSTTSFGDLPFQGR